MKDFLGAASVVAWAMRKGIEIEVTAADRARLAAIVADRNSPQKHVGERPCVRATNEGCSVSSRAAARDLMRRKYTWDRIAQQMVEVMTRRIGAPV
jgi:hypothetical protein